jgi:hypothetical protein
MGLATGSQLGVYEIVEVVSPTFGRLSTAGVARQIQVGVKYAF